MRDAKTRRNVEDDSQEKTETMTTRKKGREEISRCRASR
jgi:hypothetical protein